MASALDESTKSSGERRVVLRVKRKRNEDPVEALVVSHIIPSKKATLSDHGEKDSRKQDNITIDQVFTFVGTFPEDDASTTQHLLKNLKSKPLSHRDVKKSQKKDKLQVKLRQEKKESHQDARFKLASSNRPGQTSSDSLTSGPRENAPTVPHDDSSDAADAEVQQLFNVYDVIRDEDTTRTRETSSEDPDAILCNSVKMVREKLTVSEGNRPECYIGEKGYVYDFYYADDIRRALGDVVEITGLNDNFTLETVDREFDEMFDDEEDSNDENNWRNDYPDEGESSCEEDHRLPDPDFGFNIDDDDTKYHSKAFGEDLSSDDELDYYGLPYRLNACPRSGDGELNDPDEGF